MAAEPHWFIVPDLDGPASGGTLFNRELIMAVGKRGGAIARISLPEALSGVASTGTLWLDSLYIDHVEAVLARRQSRERFGILLHYLPSLVAHGDALTPEQLGESERLALAAADLVLTPSEYMRRTACRLGAKPQGTFVVEPASSPAHETTLSVTDSAARAIVVGSVVAGKGVLALLEALGRELAADDDFRLWVVGDVSREPAYAAACAKLARHHAALRDRVVVTGELPHDSVLERLAASNLLLSASRMESYGIALAEARNAGLAIVALPGGNAAAHVSPSAGGELARDETELARRALSLSRNRAELLRRRSAALAHRPEPRSWLDAAREFLNEVQLRAPGR